MPFPPLEFFKPASKRIKFRHVAAAIPIAGNALIIQFKGQDRRTISWDDLKKSNERRVDSEWFRRENQVTSTDSHSYELKAGRSRIEMGMGMGKMSKGKIGGPIRTSIKAARAKTSTENVESALDKVAQTISQGIRSGIFVPGQHLLEPELTRRIGISRGSLREALKHLAAAGLVTLNRYRGAYISALDKKSVLDLLDTLEPLARLAARLAAEHCDTPEQKQRMRDAATAIEAAGKEGNRGRYLEMRRHFYDTMVDIGGNRELARVMPLSRTDLFRAQVERIQTEQQRQRHASGYSRIAKGIIEGDPGMAERAVKRHFDGTRKTMKDLPDHAFPASDTD